MLYSSQMKQVELNFRTWGGRREGAGRPKKQGSGMPHVPRATLAPRFPVHATWRMQRGVWNLRSGRSARALAPALFKRAVREGFRLVHFALMGDHIHLMVEASDRVRLARGMQGLGVRIARALNRMMKRDGRVIAKRYHAHILKTPTEVRYARNYLLRNAHKHYGWKGPDPFAPRRALAEPRTWLMRQHC